ncbi:hypothetical protein V5H08_11860 [Vibrio cholerae]|uniref:hypothetical protein n=1 Tax=Vibrio cholerae TaxID=666 RepID=UPI003967069A
MKMTPHQILTALGFDVPEQGIEVSEHDGYLHAEALRLLGKTISIDRIDSDDLVSLHDGMAGLVATHRGEEVIQASEDTAERIKALIRANCIVTYKLNVESQA